MIFIFILINTIHDISCVNTEEQIYTNIANFTGKSCLTSDVIFEYKVESVIECSTLCSTSPSCAGVFYTRSTLSCVGCGIFYTNDTTPGVGEDETTCHYKYVYANGWSTFGGSFYQLYHLELQYEEAEEFCEVRGSTLVYLETTEENEYIKGMAANYTASQAFVGLTLDTSEGKWRWGEDGVEATITDWAVGEPNNVGGNEFCATLHWFYQYRWVDGSCNSTYSFICEKR